MRRDCNECGGHGEHEVWCSVAPAEIPAPLPESVWFAVGERGSRTRFTMAPGATEAQALRFAARLGANELVSHVEREVR